MKNSALLAELRRLHGGKYALHGYVCHGLCFPLEGRVAHRHVVTAEGRCPGFTMAKFLKNTERQRFG